MTRSGESSRGKGLTRDRCAVQPGRSRLLWVAGLAAVALAAAAFVLWARNGAVILSDMMLALCV